MFGKRTRSRNNLNLSRESLDANRRESLDVDQDSFIAETSGYPVTHGPQNRHADFSAHYIGAVSMFMMLPGTRKSMESQLVAKIEEEQLDGKLKLKPAPTDCVRLRLDRHGFQIRREEGDDIILRVPLHTLAQLIMYDDGFSKSNLAIKVIVGKDLFSCHVFQCLTEETAMSICETLQIVFTTIMAESDNAI